MKKFNLLIAVFTISYIFIFLGIRLFIINSNTDQDKKYQVEISRILNSEENDALFINIDLSSYTFIKNIEFLPLEKQYDLNHVLTFYKGKTGYLSKIEPVISRDGALKGYARFDYVQESSYSEILIVFEVVLAAVFILFISTLLYIRIAVITPFNKISMLPYELSKGHFNDELNESKNKYFGKFLWGLGLLRDTLNSHKNKELKLAKEKKMMLLSISHDIKTPLNTIKLYSKALSEDVYDTEDKKKKAAGHIGIRALEIEAFVNEIIKTSKEDVLDIDVKSSEFYLRDLINKVTDTYKPKCNLVMTEFKVLEYDNKLVTGDLDRAYEVFENIIENALKYGDGKEISISFYEEDYCQLVRIHNTGKPVSQNDINHIFESFYRGSNASEKEGNGLGLYICKTIMVKMGGDIFAEADSDGMSFVAVFAQ